MKTVTKCDVRSRQFWLSRPRYIFLIILILGCILYTATYDKKSRIEFIKKEIQLDLRNPQHQEKYFVKTNVCSIPAMKPLNDEVKKYVHPPYSFRQCPHATYSLLENNETHIWVTKDIKSQKHYGVYNLSLLKCCYAPFYRPDSAEDIYSDTTDSRIKYEKCVNFNDIIEIKRNHEYVRVDCRAHIYEKNYDRFYIFTPKKQRRIPRNKIRYNILILGIDNVSRLNFHRTMSKTARFLKERNGVEMLGYNKVGDNSFPNIIPLLMGYDIREIKTICFPTNDSYFDNCPLIWHWYKEAGYYTAFGEDSAYMGTFNRFMNGFCKTPTDYYMHPFIMEAQNWARKNLVINTWQCINEHFNYQILLNYIESLTQTLKSSSMFGFFWEVTISHDDLNLPIIMDDSYEQLLTRLELSGYLNNTILLLMSDHGIRWGPIRHTRQGYFEERLPLAYFLMPISFQQRYPTAFSNLQNNSRQLSTPFDVHETLLDLLNLTQINDKEIEKRSKSAYTTKRGISLFLKILGNRTCEAAGIDDHWCSCHHRVPISINSKKALLATENFLKIINSLLLDYSECEKLSLSETLKVEELKTDLSVRMKSNWREFTVTIRVNPSGGIFEGTLRDSDWKMIGTVSRLNFYRNQSSCVRDSQLKLYCYCKTMDDKTDNFTSGD